MEKNSRILTKAVTWQLMGFVVMTVINYVYLGSWHQSLGLSVLLGAIGLVGYYVHEWVWARIAWGRKP